MCKPPPPLNINLMLSMTLTCLPLQQYRACVVDSLGLGITCHITVLCVQAVMILSPLLFMSSHILIYLYTSSFQLSSAGVPDLTAVTWIEHGGLLQLLALDSASVLHNFIFTT